MLATASSRQSILLAVCFATLVAIPALEPASASACGESKSAKAKRAANASTRAPVFVGDSTGILSVPKLSRLGIEANSRGCRQFSEGLQLISQRKRARRLPHVVIIALGANGPIQNSQIRRALSILGPERVLVLVTPPRSGASAGAMRRAAKRNRNRVLLVDWAKKSAGRGGWYWDAHHPNHTGAAAFSRMIKNAVKPYAFPAVKKLRLPKTTEESERCGVIHRGGKRYRVFLVRGDERSTCDGAMSVARRPMMKQDRRWRIYDLRGTRSKGPWQWAQLNPSRGALVAITK